MVICVYGASSDTIHPDFLKAGEALGSAMARRGHSLVFGGGGHGLMGAVARGVQSGGGSIVGVAPRFFNVHAVHIEKPRQHRRRGAAVFQCGRRAL